jgi:hypothetical protein
MCDGTSVNVDMIFVGDFALARPGPVIALGMTEPGPSNSIALLPVAP